MAEGFMIEPPQKKAKLSLKLKKPPREVQNTMFPSPISKQKLRKGSLMRTEKSVLPGPLMSFTLG